MKFNYFTKRLMSAVLCVVAIAITFLSSPAMAAGLGDQIKGAADDVRAGSKELIRDTKTEVKKAADDNSSKVDRTDERGGFFSRKANRDQARIEERANKHAARTEKAVDKSMDAVKEGVDNVKGAFKK